MTRNTTKAIFATIGVLYLVGSTMQHDAKPSATASASTSFGYDEIASRRICEAAIRQRVAHPSTLNIHSFIGYGTTVLSNDDRLIRQDFDASNGYGATLTYTATCRINPAANSPSTSRKGISE